MGCSGNSGNQIKHKKGEGRRMRPPATRELIGHSCKNFQSRIKQHYY